MPKEATLKIGNSFVDNGKAVKEVAEAIKLIFDSAKLSGIEQETIRTALQTLGQIAKVENVTVSHSVFKGDETVNMGESDKETSEEE